MKILISLIGAAAALTSTVAKAGLDDAQAADLMKRAGCSVCHTVDKKLVGPPYKEVAAKRKSEAGAQATLEKAVRDGSKGIYGPVPMPPNPAVKVSDQEVHDLVQWLLTK